MNAVFVCFVVVVVGLVVLAVKLVQVWRAPDDLPLRTVIAAIVAIFLANIVNLPAARSTLDGIEVGIAKLSVNLVTLVCAYLVMAFFLYSLRGYAALSRTRRERIVLSIACCVVTGAWLLAPKQIRQDPAALTNSFEIHGRIFLLAAMAYMGYAMIRSLSLVREYTRQAISTHVRRGMWIVHASLYLLLLGVALKVVVLFLQTGSVSVTSPTLVIPNHGYLYSVGFGIMLFTVGLGYASISGMILSVPVWIRHRDQARRLDFLWRAVCEDGHANGAPALLSEPRRGFGLPHVHRTRYARVMEIREGIINLAPFYDQQAAEAAEAEADRRQLSGAERDRYVQASLIVHAVQAKGTTPTVERANLAAFEGGVDLDSDAEWLAAVSVHVQELMDTPVPGSSQAGKP
ncbi:MAB_1171c family putative transporter [Nonomuraea sp. NPDC050556]|uniref:MAB_1171c family putative transporter n=1 Tax=Nonomuraea sp. NPDC050556 TaxID=3364369 RepID=UPI00378EDCAA